MKTYEYRRVLIEYDPILKDKLNLYESPKVFGTSDSLTFDYITIIKVKLYKTGNIRLYFRPTRRSFIIGTIKQRYSEQELLNILKELYKRYVGLTFQLDRLQSISY
jgi:hypothetical protein